MKSETESVPRPGGKTGKEGGQGGRRELGLFCGLPTSFESSNMEARSWSKGFRVDLELPVVPFRAGVGYGGRARRMGSP